MTFSEAYMALLEQCYEQYRFTPLVLQLLRVVSIIDGGMLRNDNVIIPWILIA